MEMKLSGDRSVIEIPVMFSITSVENLDGGNLKLTGEMHVEFEKPSLDRRPCELIVAYDGDTYRLISVRVNPEADDIE